LKDVEKLEVENLCGMFGQIIKLSHLFSTLLLLSSFYVLANQLCLLSSTLSLKKINCLSISRNVLFNDNSQKSQLEFPM
jgi:hypothetical protein